MNNPRIAIITFVMIILLIGCNQHDKPAYVNEKDSTNAAIEGNVPPDTTASSLSFTNYDTPPELIQSTKPVYPVQFRKTGIQGRVVLEIEVLKDGSVGKIIVRNSLLADKGGLDDAAIATVRHWKYKPALLKGKPVVATIIQAVDFNLNN